MRVGGPSWLGKFGTCKLVVIRLPVGRLNPKFLFLDHMSDYFDSVTSPSEAFSGFVC